MVEGTLDVLLGEQTVRAGPGAFVLVPRGQVHGLMNPGPGPTRVLVLLSPPGFEGFFAEVGEPARARSLPPPPSGPPDMARLAALGRKYKLELVGPPPGP